MLYFPIENVVYFPVSLCQLGLTLLALFALGLGGGASVNFKKHSILNHGSNKRLEIVIDFYHSLHLKKSHGVSKL